MDAKRFTEVAEARIAHCRKVLLSKGEEYSRDGDRLHNFKTAAAIDRETPEQALWGMAKKHIVSVRDMVADTGSGKAATRAQIDEKITDLINYALLLEGLLVERGGVDTVPVRGIGTAGSAAMADNALGNLARCCRGAGWVK